MEKMIGFEDIDALSISHLHFEGDEEPVLAITDRDGLDWLVWVEQFMSILRTSEKPVFSIGYDARGYIRSNPKDLMLHAVMVIRRASFFLEKHFPYHEFSPSVDLFMRVLGKRAYLPEFLSMCGVVSKNIEATVVLGEVHCFVTDCWKGLRGEEYKKRIGKFSRRVSDSSRDLLKYESRLFNRFSRLVAVRVDLFYKMRNDFQVIGEAEMLKSFLEDRDAYFISLSNDLRFKSLVGYFWKIEYCLERGFHIHCFLFFDGLVIDDDIGRGLVCGEKWNEITKGRGSYWNCNSNKEVYKNVGLGVVSMHDLKEGGSLLTLIEYITKNDYFLRLKRRVVGRMYGKGVIKKANQPTTSSAGSSWSGLTIEVVRHSLRSNDDSILQDDRFTAGCKVALADSGGRKLFEQHGHD